MTDRMPFADAIRRVRTSAKMTQRELASRAGLSRTQVVRIEGGLKPGPQARQRLIGAFGFTNLNELYAAAGEPKATKALAHASVRRRTNLTQLSTRSIEETQTFLARWRLLA